MKGIKRIVALFMVFTFNEYMDWYRLNGQDLDGVKFLNETIGSDNTFVVKSK